MDIRPDVGTPPPLLIEHAEVCADAPRLREAIDGGVQLALSNGAFVAIEFRSAGATRKGIEAEARLTLPTPDGTVETRTFTNVTRSCASIARALGAWVTVRMDDWADRKAAREADAEAAKSTAAPKAGSVVMSPTAPEAGTYYENPTSGIDTTPDVDRDGNKLDEPRGEITATSSIMSGLSRSTLIGGAVAATFPVAERFALRATMFYYASGNSEVTALGHRMEICRRYPGRYARFHGLSADICLTGEIGALQREFFGAAGPAMTLQGELTRDWSLDLAGGVALPFGGNVIKPEGGNIAVALRGDLGLTWRIP